MWDTAWSKKKANSILSYGKIIETSSRSHCQCYLKVSKLPKWTIEIWHQRFTVKPYHIATIALHNALVVFRFTLYPVHQGVFAVGTWEPSVKILSSPFSAEFWRHWFVVAIINAYIMPSHQNEEMKLLNIRFLEWESNPHLSRLHAWAPRLKYFRNIFFFFKDHNHIKVYCTSFYISINNNYY